MKPVRLALFASGNGSNAEAIMAYFSNHPTVEVALVLSNNPQAFVLERAKQFSVDTVVFDRHDFAESDTVLRRLQQARVTHVVLAGFLWLIPTSLLRQFPDRIVNIHPSLLPKFGGKGMYGLHVHRAVREAHESVTGISIHVVNEQYDKGAMLFQATCPVLASDTAEDIAARVHQLEHEHYPRQIEKWVSA